MSSTVPFQRYRPSTAECERTFSTMNIIVTDQQSSLTVENTRNLLVLNINGPPIQEFCPTSYVKKWLKSHRSASDTKSRVCKDKSSDIEKRSLWDLFK